MAEGGATLPTSFRIDTERRTVFSSGAGVLSDDDLRGHQRQLLGDPAFDPSFNQLWDFRQVVQVDVSSETLRALATARSFAPSAKRAAVAPRNILYGMARMFEMLHNKAPEEFRVFRNIREAADWLGLD